MTKPADEDPAAALIREAWAHAPRDWPKGPTLRVPLAPPRFDRIPDDGLAPSAGTVRFVEFRAEPIGAAGWRVIGSLAGTEVEVTGPAGAARAEKP